MGDWTNIKGKDGEFRAYVVEVCQSCGWNHLASSYVLGTGEPRSRRGRQAQASE